MHRFARIVTLVTTVGVVGGCYNARVETGLAPSQKVVKEAWAPSWIAGAVSPPTMQTAAECPNGVAQVHTYHSFLNMLVGVLTFSIFTPMSIEVTCALPPAAAGAGGDLEVQIDPEGTRKQQAIEFQRAVDLSASTGQAVTVRF